jgi:hypothetical protein
VWTGLGDAIALAVSSQIPTVAATVWSQVRSCMICDGQSGTRAGFLIFCTNSHSTNSSTFVHYLGPVQWAEEWGAY